MSQNQEGTQNQNEEKGKIGKRFKKNLQRLTAVLSGDNSAFSSKVPNTELATLVQQMVAERRQKAQEEVVSGLSRILDKKIEFDKFVAQQQKELEKAIENKQKDFSEEIEKIFAKIENIDTIERDYFNTLSDAETQTETATEQ